LRIIESDYNDAVRLEALKKIDDADTLQRATNDLNPLMKIHAYERLGWDFELKKSDTEYDSIDFASLETIEDENMLYMIANNDSSSSIRRRAFDKITDKNILFDLVLHNRQFAHMALKRISDKNLLLNIALYSNDKSLARKAVKKIDDDFLLWAVQNNPYNDISEYIVGRFRDESLLEIIALNNSNPFIRKAAVNKIKSHDILIRLGYVECEEMVCTAIVRKCRDKDLLEYIGLSNPCKTVRRYVESVTDDENLLYRFALKEYEFDNRRDTISKMTNEIYIADLLKRESHDGVFRADFKITDYDILMDLFENSCSFEAKRYVLANIGCKSLLMDFVYSSPFISQKHEKLRKKDPEYYHEYLQAVILVLAGPHFNDMKYIEEVLIQNYPYLSSDFFKLRDKVDISSIYRIALNCKSSIVRKEFKKKLKYNVEYKSDNDRDDDRADESSSEKPVGLGALFW